jgi:hypothetical protein
VTFDQLAHDFRVLDLIAEVEAARDHVNLGRRRRRTTILDLGPTPLSPAQISGPQRHGHPYHIEPLYDADARDEEPGNASTRRTQLQQHQFRIQQIRRQLERHSRRWPGNPPGGAHETSSPSQTPEMISIVTEWHRSTPDSQSRAAPRVQSQEPIHNLLLNVSSCVL